MAEPISLREVRPADAQALKAVRPDWNDFAAESFLLAVASSTDVHLFLLEASGDPVATIAIMPAGTTIHAMDGVGYTFQLPEQRDIAWIDEVAVAPDLRGSGVALQAIDKGAHAARLLGYRRVEMRTRVPLPPHAVATLQFQELGQTDLPDGQVGYLYGRNV